VESGHHGVGGKVFQKISRNSSEMNFVNNKFDPDTNAEYITLMSVLPFEDQEELGKYMSGREPIRMSGGKPMGTRKIAAIDRLKNGGVSGLSIIAKDKNGLMSTGWIQYKAFKDGSALLNFPVSNVMPSILVTSDHHIGSKQENTAALKGLIRLYIKGLVASTGIFLLGQKIKLFGNVEAGDVVEANSAGKWDHRRESDRPRLDGTEYIIKMLSKLDINNKSKEEVKEEIFNKVIKNIDNFSRQGSNESMGVLLSWVADYCMEFISPALKESNLQYVHVSVAGNHSAGVLYKLDIGEMAYLAERLKALNIPFAESGGDGDTKQPRVFLGGFDIARVAFIENYGVGVDGANIFGPIRFLVQHDPKSRGSDGMVGAGKSANAGVTVAGHTHENKTCVYNTGYNTFSVAYRVSCTQGVDPTQMYYTSVPRTSAGHIVCMPQKGIFFEITIPIEFLQELGREKIREEIKNKLGFLIEKLC
jgi:hypothetical protein